MAENVTITQQTESPAAGSAGLETRLDGQATTVSGAAAATGGINPGNLIETDIDSELFKFRGDDTPLMQLMLKAKTVSVKSPKVQHYMIDEERCTFQNNAAVTASSGQSAELPLDGKDQKLVNKYDTIVCQGIDGYDETGTKTPGIDLMLFVTGKNESNGNPIVYATNGPRSGSADMPTVPAIAKGTNMVVCANALYETQKIVPPDLIVPKPTIIYLQKRGMNQVVSDYFDAQKKRIPFTQALIAEAAIAKFKRKGNRTLWIGNNTEFQTPTDKTGVQTVYTTKGILWQFLKQFEHSGKWTYEEFIGLAKTFFTGEDVPSTCVALCGKNFLENVQCIDFSKHPEVQISVKENETMGWKVTNIHTVFGDIQLKREPTLDKIGYSNSAALLGEDRLVHYVYKSESQFNEDIEGEEAKRSGVLVWDGLALKGSCHIFVNCEGYTSNSGSVTYKMWDSAEAPSTTSGTASPVYYLLQDCAGIAADAKAGEMWQYDGTAWKEYTGTVVAA